MARTLHRRNTLQKRKYLEHGAVSGLFLLHHRVLRVILHLDSLSICTKKKKKVVFIRNWRVPKIAFSPSLLLLSLRNRVTRSNLELLFTSVSDVEVQWSILRQALSSTGTKNAYRTYVMDATPRECREHAQSITTHAYEQPLGARGPQRKKSRTPCLEIIRDLYRNQLRNH